MRALLVVVFLLLTAQVAGAADAYLEVTAPATRKMGVYLAPATTLSGAPAPTVPKETADVFTFDLNLAGPFNVTSGGTGPAAADLVLKTAYAVAGDRVTLECRLFDSVMNREVAAKRYTGAMKDVRHMAHAFSDEVLRAVTGERGAFTGRVAFVTRHSGNKEIAIMDYDGKNVERITNNGSINLNPDFDASGREIIYTSYKKGNPDLYRRALFTGAEARISARPGLNASATFSPDGKRIALAMTKDGNSEIYLLDSSGKELARLTRDPAIDVSPAWSPDGTRIAFVSDRLGKPQIFTMNADGSNVRRLTTSGAYNVTPRWSPKGDVIAYARQEGGGFQIHTIGADGSGDTRLTDTGSNQHPHWSPDGRFIIFDSRRDGADAIYVMRRDGSAQTRVSVEKGAATQPVWSRPW